MKFSKKKNYTKYFLITFPPMPIIFYFSIFWAVIYTLIIPALIWQILNKNYDGGIS